MKILSKYVVYGGLKRSNGDEAQVGDSVILYTYEGQEIPATIVFPIATASCGKDRSYSFEYEGDTIRASDIEGVTVLDALALLEQRVENIEQQFLTPEDFGAKGDGVTDDTEAFQDFVNAIIASGRAGKLEAKTYRVTSAITANGPFTLLGDSVAALYGRRTAVPGGNNGSDVFPTVAPYLSGSVILQDGPGEHGFHITTTGASVRICDLGIKFGDGHRFNNTGHGIFADPPPALTPEFGSEQDCGIFGGGFERVYVYGHDGDHYAFHVTNMQLSKWSECQGWGGGGLCWYINTRGYFGNSTLDQCYFCSILEGTAHGWHLYGNPLGGNGFIYGLFDRPQSFFYADKDTLEGQPNPYNPPNHLTQWLFKMDERVWYVTATAVNMEYTGPNVYKTDEKLIMRRPGNTWQEAKTSGLDPTTSTSTVMRLYSDHGDTNKTQLKLTSFGTGNGSASSITFSNGKAEDAFPAFISGKYIAGEGVGIGFSTGGGGDNCDGVGNENLFIHASGKHEWKTSPYAAATSDLVRINTGIAPFDPALAIALPSAGTYAFEIVASFLITGDGTSNGLRFWVITAPNSFLRYTCDTVLYQGTPDLVGSEVTQHAQRIQLNTNNEMGAPTYTGDHHVSLRITGSITATAAGSLALAWGQLVSTNVNYTRLAGSYITARLV